MRWHIRTLSVAFVLVAASLAGCLAEVEEQLGGGAEAAEPRVTPEAVTAWDGSSQLLALTLKEGDPGGHPVDAVTLRVTTEQGNRAALDGTSLCRTPALEEGACEVVVEPSQRWMPGETLYAPCPSPLTSVEVTVEGLRAVDAPLKNACSPAPSQGQEGNRDGRPSQEEEGSDDEGSNPEQASATASGADLDDNGDVEWIQLTLTKGENAPYDAADVTNSTVDNNGNQLGYLCDDASDNACETTNTEFREADGDTWDVGETLWVPCQAAGNHQITISVEGTAVLDQTVSCDEAA